LVNGIANVIGTVEPPWIAQEEKERQLRWAQTVEAVGEKTARELGWTPESPVDPVLLARLLGEEKARELGLAPEAQPVSLGQGLQKTPWLVAGVVFLGLWMVSRGQPAEAEGSKTD